MKKSTLFIALALFVSIGTFAQEKAPPPDVLFENVYIQANLGMEAQLEAAIQAHNKKFHPDGPNHASLLKVNYGEKAGWYVWIFGPTPWSGLDTRINKENGHADDWAKTVDPLVAAYGDVTLWQLNHDLSFGMDILSKSSHYEAWVVDIKRGEYYRFKALAENMKEAYESLGNTAFLVFNNQVHTSKGDDVAILWSFNTWEEWSKDQGAKDAFEKLHGSGSWQNMLNEWEEITIDFTTEIRERIK